MQREKLRRSLLWALPSTVAFLLAGCGPGETDSGVTQIRPVTVAPVEERVFQEVVTVQATLAAKNTCAVSPVIAGTIEKLLVDEGDRVEAGKTVCFVPEHTELERSRAIAAEALAVAQAAVREREANLKRVRAELEQAERDFERYARLFREDKAVSKVAYEQALTKRNALKATEEHALALLDLAEQQEEQARLSLQIAEKRLSDATILAPITGVVTKRLREPGEFAEAGHPVLFLADPSELEIQAYLAHRFYARVRPGQTRLEVKVLGKPKKRSSLIAALQSILRTAPS